MSNPSIPHQLDLFPRRERGRATVATRAEGYRLANLECAAIIAADTLKYPLGSLMQVWAGMVLDGAARWRSAWRLVA